MPSAKEVLPIGEPVLHFQPAIDLSTGRLLGFEALVRWDHPDRGLLPPLVLLPWAESHGHIVALNSWVMAEACWQAAGWPSGIQVAVNCSTSQLRKHQASLAATEALKNSGLNPDRLTIEVKETTVADEHAGEDLRALSGLGVHLAVDNVGTSWSTLGNLRRFSIETAKIDREFISGLEPKEGMYRAITEAIVHVCHSLSLSTVAEGIEMAEQVAILKELGADVGQGYFFARPLPAEEANELANSQPRKIFAVTAETELSNTKSVESHHLTLVPGTKDTELEIGTAHVL
jgi:EAL domain-containing protein (putative c-di-GMP-specific phosphodiesterase class I)